MSLFRSPEEHAANPPGSWRVVKAAHGIWGLETQAGLLLGSFASKSGAERSKSEGFYIKLYEMERRWYAGEPVAGWTTYIAKESQS